MTRRNMEDMPLNSSPALEVDGSSMMSPPPPQASPAERSPLRDSPGGSPAMLATMTPVNVMELKKEMEEESAMGRTPLYAQVKTEVNYDKDELYAAHHHHHQGMTTSHHDKNDTSPPIDLIYEDGNKTVIYTTAFDQKSLEIYSADNSGEITINNISTHQIHNQQIADSLIDGNASAMVSTVGAESVGSPPGTVSVVLQGNGQGLLQYPQAQVPTVLVLSEMPEDEGVPVPVIGLR